VSKNFFTKNNFPENLSTPNTIVLLGFPPRWLEASFFDYITTLESDTTCSYSPDWKKQHLLSERLSRQWRH